MTFYDCVIQCAGTPDLVKEFDRLTGHNLADLKPRSGLDRMIDEATGRDKEGLEEFLRFVFDCIWTRLPTMPYS